MRFKTNKVWLATDAGEHPLIEKGKVLIKYQLDQPHEYWVHPSKVVPLDSADATPQAPKKRPLNPDAKAGRRSATITVDRGADTIHIYTDGACSGNPGPAGIGVVLRYKEKEKEISRFLGAATNNIAELEAIKTGLLAVKNRDLPVLLHTDSSYALGLLTRGWKAKQNESLVEEVRRIVASFKQLQFVKVKGHAGDPDNERADRLAVQAIRQAGG
ncbi:MAG: ribonuclease HI [Desulfatitalea sp.]|nr:ribonuclease HI [Desulfatitalea sp.]